MKQRTSTRRAASLFHRTVARKQFSIEESTTDQLKGTGREHYELPIYLVRSFYPIAKEMAAVD